MSDASDKDPRPASTVLLLRDEPEFQVLMVRRHHQIDFAAGALVFPGGKVQAGDQLDAWREHVQGWDRHDPVQRALRICAIRETFEETGVLLAQTRGGGEFADRIDLGLRHQVDRGEVSFIDVVRELGVSLRLDELRVFARWITPAMMPKRFDTWFFAFKAPTEQLAVCDGRETVDAEWIPPKDALRLGEIGERTIVFATQMNLRLLSEARDAADCLSRAQQRPLVQVLPTVEQREGESFLVLPSNAGYGSVVIPLAKVSGAPSS